MASPWPFAAALLIAAVLVTACERTPPPPPGLVAVIDLDRVARALGREQAITARVQAHADAQSAQLNELRDALRRQIDEFRAQTEELPPAESEQRLAALIGGSERRLREAIEQSQAGTDRLKVDLVLEFKQAVQPVARRVATARNLSLVLIQQNAMLYVDPAVDITDAVIDEMQRQDPIRDSGPEPQGRAGS